MKTQVGQRLRETRIGKAQTAAIRAGNRARMAQRFGKTRAEIDDLWSKAFAADRELRRVCDDPDASMEYRIALYS